MQQEPTISVEEASIIAQPQLKLDIKCTFFNAIHTAYKELAHAKAEIKIARAGASDVYVKHSDSETREEEILDEFLDQLLANAAGWHKETR